MIAQVLDRHTALVRLHCGSPRLHRPQRLKPGQNKSNHAQGHAPAPSSWGQAPELCSSGRAPEPSSSGHAPGRRPLAEAVLGVRQPSAKRRAAATAAARLATNSRMARAGRAWLAMERCSCHELLPVNLPCERILAPRLGSRRQSHVVNLTRLPNIIIFCRDGSIPESRRKVFERIIPFRLYIRRKRDTPSKLSTVAFQRAPWIWHLTRRAR